jgi:hypothetical protein
MSVRIERILLQGDLLLLRRVLLVDKCKVFICAARFMHGGGRKHSRRWFDVGLYAS